MPLDGTRIVAELKEVLERSGAKHSLDSLGDRDIAECGE